MDFLCKESADVVKEEVFEAGIRRVKKTPTFRKHNIMKTCPIRGLKRPSLTLMLVCFLLSVSVSGCRSRREVVLEKTETANMTFEPTRMPEDLQLGKEDMASFVLWDVSRYQSRHVLQLAPDAALKARYHRNYDMTLFGVSGIAVVSVEGRRHIMEQGTAIFIPRMHEYSITPHESPGNVIAVMVYSPPFDGSDALILDK